MLCMPMKGLNLSQVPIMYSANFTCLLKEIFWCVCTGKRLIYEEKLKMFQLVNKLFMKTGGITFQCNISCFCTILSTGSAGSICTARGTHAFLASSTEYL